MFVENQQARRGVCACVGTTEPLEPPWSLKLTIPFPNKWVCVKMAVPPNGWCLLVSSLQTTLSCPKRIHMLVDNLNKDLDSTFFCLNNFNKSLSESTLCFPKPKICCTRGLPARAHRPLWSPLPGGHRAAPQRAGAEVQGELLHVRLATRRRSGEAAGGMLVGSCLAGAKSRDRK